MNAMCRPCLCVLFVVGCISTAMAEEKPKRSQTEYDRWIQPYTTESRTSFFPVSEDAPKNVQVPTKLIVTALVGNEAEANEEDRQNSQGCQVAADGRVEFFYEDLRGSKGGGYPTIPDADRKRLDQLLSNLPDDGGHLPPPGRRLVLQVPEGDHFRVRVYDRANAPDEIWDILRICLFHIRSWVPEVAPENDLESSCTTDDGIFALTPNGQLVSSVEDRQLRFWDPSTHKELKQLPLPNNILPNVIKFSPDGSLAVLTGYGDCYVMETKTWKVVRDIQEPMVGRYGGYVYFPQFTADGRFLLLLCSQPDADGNRTILPRAYDTKTWERYDKLPGLPDNALSCIESPKGKRAVILLKGNSVALWDTERHRQYAKLDEDVQIHEVAFSRDESKVAVTTVHKRGTIYRIRIWKMDNGELVRELCPFEQNTCEKVVGLQWTADGKYILAATKADTFGKNCDINVWNVRSGRQRGNLVGGLPHPMGVVLLPGENHIAAGVTDSDDSAIRFWDFASAMKQIRTFETSLAKPAAGK